MILKFAVFSLFAISMLGLQYTFGASSPQYVEVDPPLKQMISKFFPEKVICKQDLVLVIKYNGSPACVKSDSAQILQERGWGVISPPCCKELSPVTVAKVFIRNSPTFAFDGISDSLKAELVTTRESFPEQHVIRAEFSSTHGGYGDRTNQMVTEAITHHVVDLVVVEEIAISIIIDNKWDEINQVLLPSTPTKEPKVPISTHNTEHFTLNFKKEGGIAGIQEAIFVDSEKRILFKTTSEGLTETMLDDSDMALLYDTLNESELFGIGSLVYQPEEGWADYFSYKLEVVSGESFSNIVWTDAMEEVPQNLILISQTIELLSKEP